MEIDIIHNIRFISGIIILLSLLYLKRKGKI